MFLREERIQNLQRETQHFVAKGTNSRRSGKVGWGQAIGLLLLCWCGGRTVSLIRAGSPWHMDSLTALHPASTPGHLVRCTRLWAPWRQRDSILSLDSLCLAPHRFSINVGWKNLLPENQRPVHSSTKSMSVYHLILSPWTSRFHFLSSILWCPLPLVVS